MSKKIIQLSKYLKKARRQQKTNQHQETLKGPAEIISLPLPPKAISESKEKTLLLDGKKVKKKHQKKIEKIKSDIKKMLNNEPMSEKKLKRLNKLLTHGIYFMLYEKK